MDPSRRQFLRTVGLVGSIGVGGCVTEAQQTRPQDLEEWPPTPYSDTLTYWSWQHYWRIQAQAFQFEAGLDDINSETVPAVVQYQRLANGERPDVVTLPSRSFERAVEADLLEPFSPDVVPCWPPTETTYTHDESYYLREGDCYGIPQTPMRYALSYHREEVDRPTSWALLWDESLAGRISMPADPILASQIAALYTRQDPNDPDDIDAIREALVTQQSLVDFYWVDWNDCWQAFRDHIRAAVLPNPRMCLCSQDETPAVSVAPEEGVLYSQNTLAIPREADHPYTALRFIDWSVDFKTGTNATWHPSDWSLYPHRALDSATREAYDSIGKEIGINPEM